MTDPRIPLRDHNLPKRPGQFGEGEQPPPPPEQGKTADEIESERLVPLMTEAMQRIDTFKKTGDEPKSRVVVRDKHGQPVSLVKVRRRPKDT